MAYILLVNPQVLGTPHTGLELTDVVVGTAVASAFGSILVGYCANLPFGLAPGLGLSAYLSYGLVKGKGIPWEGALATSFLAGAIMVFLAITNLSDIAMAWIPRTIKIATVIGMGLLLTFIGMQSIELVVSSGDDSLVMLGPLDRFEIWLSLAGLLLLATLSHHRVKGAVVLGIFIVTVIMWIASDNWPHTIVEWPSESAPIWKKATHLSMVLKHLSKYGSGICAFLLVGVFDVSGVMFGLAVLANLHKEDHNGVAHVPNSKWVFIAAGLSTMLAACLGCSPIIVHIESAAGIKEGGRTGLTAVVVGLWFFISLFFAPLLGSIPQEATAPVVILIGASMMGQAAEIDWKEMRVAVPAFLTLSLMPFTFSIPNGIFFGIVSNIVLSITCDGCFGLCKNREEQIHDDISVISTPTGGPLHIQHVHAPEGYGTVDKVQCNGDMQRSFSYDSFVRSPTLLLRREEYAGDLSGAATPSAHYF
eukprot:CAMPEP_0203754170 /NCGR_PEP_ID=MMETSP0098-20131031/7808_1 /ASSEMBLY_ACC=CAM_ASM_000208 /TAXON_ID=96639 /ORGANISM=" , Strain NY0313808BC1" /LENGTH=476 /DNA_ID=CAMNT_0050645059 /DNA_START=466 /DNA_END=1896 /DNA_ORIENTATION=+